jgi:hypothetical protein
VARRPIPYLYVAMPSGFARDPNFTLEEKGLMMVLMEWARPTDGKYTVWPGVDTIAQRCHESPRTIQRALADMDKKGYITRRRRGGKSTVTVLVCMDRYRSDSISGELSDLGKTTRLPKKEDVQDLEMPEETVVKYPDIVIEDSDATADDESDDAQIVVGQDAPRNQMSAPLPAGVTAIPDYPQRRTRRPSASRKSSKPNKPQAKPSSAAKAVAEAFSERMSKSYPSYVAPRAFVMSHMMQCAEDMAKMYDIEHLKKYFDMLIGDWVAISRDHAKWIKQKTPSLHYAFRLIEELMPLALEGLGYTNASHRVSGMEEKKDSGNLTWDDVK